MNSDAAAQRRNLGFRFIVDPGLLQSIFFGNQSGLAYIEISIAML